jgi:hypothetical protein
MSDSKKDQIIEGAEIVSFPIMKMEDGFHENLTRTLQDHHSLIAGAIGKRPLEESHFSMAAD